jgi:hypothetical protein
MGRAQLGHASSSLAPSLGQKCSWVWAGTEREQVGQSRKWVGFTSDPCTQKMSD